MLNLIRKSWGRVRSSQVRGLLSNRPLVVLQSDDWGRVGVRDQEGYEILRASGISLGEQPYDFYTLETAEDVIALRDLLKRHRDSTGRPACLVMNFVTANLNFGEMDVASKAAGENGSPISLRPLTAGLPGKWSRPGLFEAYRQGMTDGVFHPALHGLTHFCWQAVDAELANRGPRALLLRTFWKAETPYIHWRMPWVGFEYAAPGLRRERFLAAETQAALIQRAAETFAQLFFRAPISACAPGYRANEDTRASWFRCGVRVVQNGPDQAMPPHMDESGMLSVYRTVEFEPSQRELPVEEYLRFAEDSFARGWPVVISVHAINFHSTLKDFRGPTLRTLDLLLSALEARHSDLLYVHDGDLYEIMTQGRFTGERGPVSVTITQSDRLGSRFAGAR